MTAPKTTMGPKEYEAIKLDLVAATAELDTGNFHMLVKRLQGVLDLLDNVRVADRRAGLTAIWEQRK